MVLAVEDGGVFVEVAQREVVVGAFDAFETAVDAVVGGDIERAFRVGDVAVIGAGLHPDLGVAAAREGRGEL